MQPPELVLPEYAQAYINLVQRDRLPDALKKNTRAFRKLLKRIPAKKYDYAYGPGKWTLRQLLQHIIDTERVFTYRALSFARRDPASLPGFDEKSWALNMNVSGRDWNDMVKEFRSLRKATERLFASFTIEDLKARGNANNQQSNVGAMGYMCAGHVAHHIKVINERYLN